MNPRAVQTPHRSNPVASAVRAIARGGTAVLVDDARGHNAGSIVVAAEHATSQSVNFMVREARGLICVAMEQGRLGQLRVPLIPPRGDDDRAAFHVGVDHARLTTTGISADDRAHTIRALADPRTVASDLTRPGHVFPLAAYAGGVPGRVEAAVEIARLAGCAPASATCEILSHDGTIARWPELQRFARRHDLPLISVADLSERRRAALYDPPPRRLHADPAAGVAAARPRRRRGIDDPTGGDAGTRRSQGPTEET